MRVEIGPLVLGNGCPPLVLPEVGINHNGKLEIARRLVEKAREAGARAIKFQCHIVEREMIHTDMKPGKISDETLWDIIESCSLTEEEERDVQRKCEQEGILYLSTPFSREAADRLHEMGVPAFKIGSGEITNLPFIEHVSRKGKPIILSTGMVRFDELDRTVALIRDHNVSLILMHCISMYPTPYDKLNLGAIALLKERYGIPVGLSDHSLGIYTGLAGAALGACIIEKHFTLDRNMAGADQKVSIEPEELKELVKGADAVYHAMGSFKGDILDDEIPVMEFARESVVAIQNVARGAILTPSNVWVKRPGTGSIKAAELPKLLGRRAARDLVYDQQLTWDDIE